MTNFNIYHVKINEFYRLYDDLILSLSGALADLGHVCSVKQNGFDPDAINILVGSTIFASRYHALPDRLEGRPYVVYQVEQLDEAHGLLSEWPEYWKLLQNALAIWDYSPSSTEFLMRKGLRNVYHVPPGFHRSLESFRPRQDPDIDVLFVGSPHERRQRLIEDLKSRGLVAVDLQAAFGEFRNRHISRSKIVLNVHAWDNLSALETVRISFLLANRSFVISEDGDHNPYGDGVVFAPYRDLGRLCAEYARQPAHIREQVAERGYLEIRKIDMITILRDTISQMDLSVPALRDPAPGYEIGAYYSQARLDLLNLVPPGARKILDIGCGGGHTGASIKQRQKCHVTGIEIVAAAALHASRLLDIAICGDAIQILPSLEDQAYDCVLMLDVLEHVEDSMALLRQAARKLTKAGVLVLCVPNVGHWSVIQGLLQGRWDYADQGILDRTHLRFFTLQSLRQLVQEAGLSIVSGTATRLNGGTPSDIVIEAARRSALPGQDVETNLHSYQFVLVCRTI